MITQQKTSTVNALLSQIIDELDLAKGNGYTDADILQKATQVASTPHELFLIGVCAGKLSAVLESYGMKGLFPEI